MPEEGESNISIKISGFMISILVFMLFFPPVCSGKALITEKQVITYHDIFEGESGNWKARYELDENHVVITANNKTHYYGEQDYLLFVTYKGNLSESSSPKRVNISYTINLPFYTPSGGSRTTAEGQGLGTDFDDEEYVFMNYFTYSGESSTEVQHPISTQEILAIKNECARLEHSRTYARRSLNHIEERSPSYGTTLKSTQPELFGFKQPEQWPFRHTIGLVCAPYSTVYVRHEGEGGTEADGNDPGKVTIELEGKIETLELKSVL